MAQRSIHHNSTTPVHIQPLSSTGTGRPMQHNSMAQGSGGGNWEQKLEAIRGQLAEVPAGESSEPVTIFRLPFWYHETNKHLYEPKMVSIGPYHHGKENLRAMEEQKWYSLRNMLDKNRNASLDQYFNAVRALERKARDCYNESVRMESPDFVTMLLLDACFIINYFEMLKTGTAIRDTICRVGWADIHLYSDLFLLENQIPFFVIHDLFTIRDGSHYCSNNRNLLDLLCNPLNEIFSTTPLAPPTIQCDQIKHLLQLYYTMMEPLQNVDHHTVHYGDGDMETPLQNVNHHTVHSGDGDMETPLQILDNGSVHQGRGNNTGTNISCVSELREAGVTFKKKNEPGNMFDISFMDGVMEIPLLKLEDTHKVILWNMAAFEQSKVHSSKLPFLSSYLALMDSQINTEKDVAILVRCGVVENYLQSNEDAAELFNQFAKSFVLDYRNHYYQDLFEKIKKYIESRWHKNRARLKHDYFRNPWTTISFLAAALLLILTALQTYFAAKS